MKLTGKFPMLYAITDKSLFETEGLLEDAVEKAIRGGAGIVQLRHKGADDETLALEAVRLKKVTSRYNVPLIINDSFKAALMSGADGVHIGLDDGEPDCVRSVLGNGFIIGVTVKTVLQARAAIKKGADYLGAGAVFESGTKKNAIRMEPRTLGQICALSDIPVFAIGGIKRENLPLLKGVGASGIAAVGSIFGPFDIVKETTKLYETMSEVLKND